MNVDGRLFLRFIVFMASLVALCWCVCTKYVLRSMYQRAVFHMRQNMGVVGACICVDTHVVPLLEARGGRVGHLSRNLTMMFL